MKTFRLLLLIVSLCGTISCEKHVFEADYNPGVENYITLLRTNHYTSDQLPAFTCKDIPALLKYRNETVLINQYPHNPISSFWGPNCKLGVLALWTIESIRAIAINSKYLVGRFPSLNPLLAKRNIEVLTLVNDDLPQEFAAKAYYEWWENNKSKNFDEFMAIDPLSSTNYRWF